MKLKLEHSLALLVPSPLRSLCCCQSWQEGIGAGLSAASLCLALHSEKAAWGTGLCILDVKFANAVKLSKTRILETVSETVPHVFNEVLKKRYNIIIYHAFVYNVIDLFVLMDGSHSIGMTWYLMRGPKYWFMLFSFFKTWWAMTAVWNKLLQTLLHCKTWGKRIENFQWFPASRTQALGECPRIRTFRGPKIGEHPAAGSLHPGQRHTNIQTVLEQTRRYTMQSTLSYCTCFVHVYTK